MSVTSVGCRGQREYPRETGILDQGDLSILAGRLSCDKCLIVLHIESLSNVQVRLCASKRGSLKVGS